MKVFASKSTVSNTELIGLLKSRFSSYSYKQFGLGSEKTILVEKSSFVGAQISLRENEITIQATPPSVLLGNTILLFSLFGLDVILGLLYRSQLKDIETDITKFLKESLT